jgi:putative Mn2+ efflux pump MntP
LGLVEIFLIALALGMDSFAVSVCKGLSMKQMKWKKAVIIGLYFGIFQALMPVIGYFLGKSFENTITSVDHWVAFVLLALIGINMIRSRFKR